MSAFFAQHREAIVNGLGLASVTIVLVVVAHLLARRAGGWRKVRRRMRRSVARFGMGLAAPFRRYLRHRRELATLTRLLSNGETWRAAERAMALARSHLDAAQPYAAVVGRGGVGVLIAGSQVLTPPDPWQVDPDDSRIWWLAVPAVDVLWRVDGGAEESRGLPPVLVALGAAGNYVAFLDMAVGPRVTFVSGTPWVAGRILQAIAAQLDGRLPSGSVFVSEGVHPRHPGPSAAETFRAASEQAAWSYETPENGAAVWRCEPVFAVCSEAPPRPTAPADLALRTLVLGDIHGAGRILAGESDARLIVHGTPLRVDVAALPRAVARTISHVPRWGWEQPESVSVDAQAEPGWAAPTPLMGTKGVYYLDKFEDSEDHTHANVGVSAARGADPHVHSDNLRFDRDSSRS